MMCAKHWLWIPRNLGTWIFLYSNSACGIPVEGCMYKRAIKTFFPWFFAICDHRVVHRVEQISELTSAETVCTLQASVARCIGLAGPEQADCDVTLVPVPQWHLEPCAERDSVCQRMSDWEAASEQSRSSETLLDNVLSCGSSSSAFILLSNSTCQKQLDQRPVWSPSHVLGRWDQVHCSLVLTAQCWAWELKAHCVTLSLWAWLWASVLVATWAK